MTGVARMRTRSVAGMVALVLAVGGLAAVAVPSQAASASLTGLRSVQVATQGMALAWDRIGDHGYRVRLSTSSSMSSPKTWDVLTPYHEWTRAASGSPTALGTRLTPGRTYYVQVKAVTRAPSTAARENVTGYSSPLRVTLPSSGYRELAPADQRVTDGGPGALHVSWRSRGPGVRYLVRYSADPSSSVTTWSSATFDASSGTLTGLQPGTRYHVRTRVVSTSGEALSEYADPVDAVAGASDSSPALDIATYNVRKISSTSDWKARRTVVASTIKAADPEVIGLQEATPTTWSTNRKRMYADLVDLLGSPYALVTSGAGSSGTQMAYDTSRLTKLSSGVKKLPELGSSPRYAVWARFKDKVGGRTFFAITSHLEPGTASTTRNAARIRQARVMLDLVRDNAAGSPAVIMGDMNSSRSSTPENGPYRTFLEAGYVDPIDNTAPVYTTGENATAEHIANSAYNSANVFERTARVSTVPRGTHIDYVFTAPSMRVARWEMALRLDTAGKFIGTIGSDHNLIGTSIHLP